MQQMSILPKFKVLKRVAIFSLAMLFSFTSNAAPAPNAPEFSLTTLDNQVVEVKKGQMNKPTYLVFWATWCPSCLREVPTLKKIYAKYKDDINFIAINVDRTHFWYNLTTEESKKPVREYLLEQGINYPIALDDDNQISELYEVKGTPTQVLINSQGEMIAKFHSTPTDIDKMINSLLP